MTGIKCRATIIIVVVSIFCEDVVNIVNFSLRVKCTGSASDRLVLRDALYKIDKYNTIQLSTYNQAQCCP